MCIGIRALTEHQHTHPSSKSPGSLLAQVNARRGARCPAASIWSASKDTQFSIKGIMLKCDDAGGVKRVGLGAYI